MDKLKIVIIYNYILELIFKPEGEHSLPSFGP
jgi:hypothetical protein